MKSVEEVQQIVKAAYSRWVDEDYDQLAVTADLQRAVYIVQHKTKRTAVEIGSRFFSGHISYLPASHIVKALAVLSPNRVVSK